MGPVDLQGEGHLNFTTPRNCCLKNPVMLSTHHMNVGSPSTFEDTKQIKVAGRCDDSGKCVFAICESDSLITTICSLKRQTLHAALNSDLAIKHK